MKAGIFLDREEQKIYNLTIRAKNGGSIQLYAEVN